MRRHLSWIIAGTLLVGAAGLAACGDDDDSGNSNTTTTVADNGDNTTTTVSDSGDDSSDSGSGNADVQAYCDDVHDLAEQLDGASASDLAGLQDELAALQQSGTTLSSHASELDAADGQALADCTSELATAAANVNVG